MRNAFTKARAPLIPDPVAYAAHEGRVVDLVEACRDVPFKHPLIGAAGEVVNLGDGILSSALRAEAEAARLEVRLEDRFQDSFQSSLHNPVGHRRDAQLAHLPVGLGDLHPAHRRRAERTGLELLPDVAQELLHPELGADAGDGPPIHSRRLGPLVPGDTLESVHQERRVINQVVQITETARGILTRPPVQLQLHPSYRVRRDLSGRPDHSTGIHQCTFDHCRPPLASTLPPFPM